MEKKMEDQDLSFFSGITLYVIKKTPQGLDLFPVQSVSTKTIIVWSLSPDLRFFLPF